ncbi:hypothetical protein P171DRAFT_427355 [Karstenula rhodostoma CBS 690.94]|uniref:EthD domain-containing protein n=1 Tax=Karstenula rhodostoma CBS 690.94 TaxID=1392251 RepID=A0A9P4PVS5_9PLEO|nr:hypothetical protein P171DRAFT_427355 [Karstenula rhodostoma CBS 690.94]
MPYKCLTFIHRKPTTTPTAFRTAWETHMQLLMALTHPHQPLESVRHYPARTDSAIAQRAPVSARPADANAPLVLLGDADLVTWDCLSECTYRDELHFQQFYAMLSEKGVGERIAASEERASDMGRLKVVVVGETVVDRFEGR